MYMLSCTIVYNMCVCQFLFELWSPSAIFTDHMHFLFETLTSCYVICQWGLFSLHPTCTYAIVVWFIWLITNMQLGAATWPSGQNILCEPSWSHYHLGQTWASSFWVREWVWMLQCFVLVYIDGNAVWTGNAKKHHRWKQIVCVMGCLMLIIGVKCLPWTLHMVA